MSYRTERWDVYTTTEDNKMFGPYGPIDSDNFLEWCVGYGVTFDSDGFHARQAGAVAEDLTYGVACYIASTHNAEIDHADTAPAVVEPAAASTYQWFGVWHADDREWIMFTVTPNDAYDLVADVIGDHLKVCDVDLSMPIPPAADS